MTDTPKPLTDVTIFHQPYGTVRCFYCGKDVEAAIAHDGSGNAASAQIVLAPHDGCRGPDASAKPSAPRTINEQLYGEIHRYRALLARIHEMGQPLDEGGKCMWCAARRSDGVSDNGEPHRASCPWTMLSLEVKGE